MRVPSILFVLALGACTSGGATDLCHRVSEITVIPHKTEAVNDDVYNALLAAGEAVVPCLIDRLTDTTPMRDPRQAPKYAGVVVGDVSFFVLVDITGRPFEEMLPESWQSEYERDGVYAYFRFVESESNRELLRAKWQEWWVNRQAETVSIKVQTCTEHSALSVIGEDPKIAQSGPAAASHPFCAARSGSEVPTHSEGLSTCLTARLQIADLAPGERFSGSLSIDNRCTREVAILTAPVETRVRREIGDRFPAETGIDQVYAIAYLFRKEVGFGPDAFRGDGGLRVFTLPDYAVVKAGANASIPVTSGLPLSLDSGAYGLALFTVATWADESAAHDAEIDMRNDVTSFTKAHGRGGQVVLPLAAIRLGPVAFFDVGP